MNPTKTQLWIEGIVFKTSLLVYFVIWFSMPILLYSTNIWYVGLFFALPYALGLSYEFFYRKHIFLSADGTALPLAIVGGLIMLLLTWLFGWSVSFGQIANIFSFSYILGHLGSLLYFFGLSKVLEIKYADEIKNERESGSIS